MDLGYLKSVKSFSSVNKSLGRLFFGVSVPRGVKTEAYLIICVVVVGSEQSLDSWISERGEESEGVLSRWCLGLRSKQPRRRCKIQV